MTADIGKLRFYLKWYMAFSRGSDALAEEFNSHGYLARTSMHRAVAYKKSSYFLDYLTKWVCKIQKTNSTHYIIA